MAHVRQAWPQVEIWLRADSGFAREELMSWCEENRVEYVFGLARNQRLEPMIASELAEAKATFLATSKPARIFKELDYRTRDSWSRSRRVVAKAEHLEKGSDPRFIVTSLTIQQIGGQELYETTTVSAARWKTASRNASSTFTPIAPVPQPCGPTNSGSGSPRLPTCWSRPCGASGYLNRDGKRNGRVDPPQAVEDRRSSDGERPPHQARLCQRLSHEGSVHARAPAPAPAARATRHCRRGLTGTRPLEDQP